VDGFKFFSVLGALLSVTGALFVLITRGSPPRPNDLLALTQWKTFRTAGPILLGIGVVALFVGAIGWLGGGEWHLRLP
jgi:hypothetical protein